MSLITNLVATASATTKSRFRKLGKIYPEHVLLLNEIVAHPEHYANPAATFNPAVWGPKDHLVKATVYFTWPNCYAYALNTRRVDLHPGYFFEAYKLGKVKKPIHYTPDRIATLLFQDGLVPVRLGSLEDDLFQQFTHIILAYVSLDENDYHFVRIDADGGFSHKEGDFRPRRLAPKIGSDLVEITNRDGHRYRFLGVFSYDPTIMLSTQRVHGKRKAKQALRLP